jgi:hypothetical protein
MFYKLLLYLLCLFLGAVILSSCTSSVQQSSTPPPTVTATATSSAVSSLQACVSATATKFYQAIRDRSTSKAYAFLAPAASTQEGQKLTYATFVQQVKEGGTAKGAFMFTIGGFISNPLGMVMTINNGQMIYHSHLQFDHQGNACHITSFDRI